MNNPSRIRILVASLLTAGFMVGPAFAQDKGKPAPAPAAKAESRKGDDVSKVLVENEKVRASESTYKPGATSDMRERGPRIVRALTDGTMEKTFPDGKKETITYKAGDVKFYPKETYVQKNAGKADLVLFVVSLKY